MNSSIKFKGAGLSILLILLLLLYGRLLPTTQAVSPPPDGGYDNGNTAEGTDALLGLQLKQDSTPVSFDNTAVGSTALPVTSSSNLQSKAGFNTVVGALACGKQKAGRPTGATTTRLWVVALFSTSSVESGTPRTGLARFRPVLAIGIRRSVLTRLTRILISCRVRTSP